MLFVYNAFSHGNKAYFAPVCMWSWVYVTYDCVHLWRPGRHFLKILKFSRICENFVILEKLKRGLGSASCEKHKKEVFGEKIDPGA